MPAFADLDPPDDGRDPHPSADAQGDEPDRLVAALELVYSLHGTERVVPLPVPNRGTSVSGAHTLYLEDLKVKPGDVVSYYVRARDLPRGRRSSEARSDMFFVEVKPFEQEFTLAQSQGGGGGGGNPQIDDLVNAQKEIVVATWKLACWKPRCVLLTTPKQWWSIRPEPAAMNATLPAASNPPRKARSVAVICAAAHRIDSAQTGAAKSS